MLRTWPAIRGAHCPGSLYWAVWGDVLPVMRARMPDLARPCLEALYRAEQAEMPPVFVDGNTGAILQEAGWRPVWR